MALPVEKQQKIHAMMSGLFQKLEQEWKADPKNSDKPFSYSQMWDEFVAKQNDRMTKQYCPICNAPVTPNPRYPRYICGACYVKSTASDGRLLAFSNVDFSGGYKAQYADTGEEYLSHDCFVGNVKCYADEARFGGIVIQVVE